MISEESVRTLFRVALVMEPTWRAASARRAPGAGAARSAGSRAEVGGAPRSSAPTAARARGDRPRGAARRSVDRVRHAGQAGAGQAERGAPAATQEPKVGRNDPCPCGSGKKYKKCHGA